VHRITDLRLSESFQHSLGLLEGICGESKIMIVLITSMWGKMKDEEEASKREDELKAKYRNALLHDHNRALVARFCNDQDSAWKIIDQLINLTRHVITGHVDFHLFSRSWLTKL